MPLDAIRTRVSWLCDAGLVHEPSEAGCFLLRQPDYFAMAARDWCAYLARVIRSTSVA
jgi:hypothetical protein